MRKIQSSVLCVVGSLMMVTLARGETNLAISSLQDGVLTWANADTSMYYNIEWRASLSDSNGWVSSYRGCQDLQGTNETMSTPIPLFFRVSESSNAANTLTLSPSGTVVEAGYYEATDLAILDPDLVASNLRAGVNLFGVDGKTEVVDTSSGDATAAQILSGKKAWVNGNLVAGSMPNVGVQNVTPYLTTITISQGYHDGTGKVYGDPDLVSGNIRAGVRIFGVLGNSNVRDTSSGDATAANIQLGKKAWVDGSIVTGYLAGGVACDPASSYSPLKRWCDNGDGTVTDTRTGLVWMKDWGSFAQRDYYDASELVGGRTTAGVSAGTWRLPTLQEWKDITQHDEAVSIGSPWKFTNIPTTNSSGVQDYDVRFWCVGPHTLYEEETLNCAVWNLTDGATEYQHCTNDCFVICVLGPRHP